MNKNSLFLIFLLFIQILCPQSVSIWASNEVNEEVFFSISPKEAYVGDKVTLFYEFYSPLDLFSLSDSDILIFDSPQFSFFGSNNCLVQSVEIVNQKKTKAPYLLRIHFSSFQTGTIEVPTFDLRTFLAHESQSSEAYFGKDEIPIQIPDFEIKSILSLYPDTTLRPMQGSILVPGTSLFVYVLLCFIVVFIILFFYFSYRARKMQFSFLRLLKSLFYTVSTLRIRAKIKKTVKFPISIRDFSFRLHTLLCLYLTKRFAVDFSSYTNKEIQDYIKAFYTNLLDEEAETLLFDLQTIFVRLDYFRFSETISEVYTDGEKKVLVQTVLDFITKMERKNV